MSDDIVFIKDINDYNEYSKLRPKCKYRNKKVKYICRQCGNVNFINFHRSDKNFICPYCRAQNTKKSEYKIVEFDRIDTEEELRYYKSLRPKAPYLYKKN